MNNHMLRRLLALALSALMLLGSCSVAETVPAVGEESAPAVQEESIVSAVEEAAADEPAAEEYAVAEAVEAEDTPVPTPIPTSEVTAEPTLDSTSEVTPVPTPISTSEVTPVPLETPVTGIEIQEIRLPDRIDVIIGEFSQIVPELLPEGAQGKLSYSVDNSDIASVDAKGMLRGKRFGETTVTVTAENGCSASCTVAAIYIRATQIVLPEEIRILEGRSQGIQVKLLPEDANEEVTLSIADPEIAVMGGGDWVEGIRPGATELIATTASGLTVRTPVIIEKEGAEFYEIADGVLKKYTGCAHYIDLPEGITVIGENAFAQRYDLWEINLPKSLQRIEGGAFYGCGSMKKLTMGDAVTSIGNLAFESCYSLSSIRLSASLEEIGDNAFKNCTRLSTIELPASLRSIGESAFFKCTALTEIQLPDVTYIGAHAFSGTAITDMTVPASLGKITTAFLPNGVERVKLCEGITAIERWDFVYERPLERLELPYSLTSIVDAFMRDYGSGVTVYGPGGGYVEEFFTNRKRKFIPYEDLVLDGEFRIEKDVLVEYTGEGGRVVIPERVTKIGEKAFYGRADVTEVVFHDGVTWIDYEAFRNCTGLTELNLPDGIKQLSMYAFAGCTGLTHVEIPGSAKRFAAPFDNCTALESVVVNEGVEVCGGFAGCVNLKQVKLPSTLEGLASDGFSGCTSLTEIQIPDGVTNIGSRCFMGCTGLTEIVLPSKLRWLSFGAFENCTGLRSMRVPGTVRDLESSTFRGCTGLVSVTLSDGLQNISGGSFVDCTSLKEVYVPASVKEILYTEPPYISGPVFANCPNVTVYGKKGTEIQKYCAKAGVPFKALDANTASISFPEGNITLGVGQTYTPEIRVDSMAMLGDVTFTSSSSSRVAVNKTTGALTAKKTGTATITAKASSGAKASYKVTVKAAPKSISFKEKNIIVAVDEFFRVDYVLPANTAASVTFQEVNPYSVLEIHDDGTFRMIDPETTTLKVTTHNGKSATCTITAVPRPTALYVDRAEITLRQTCSDQIVPSVNPESFCRVYEFASSNPEIVTVDENGRLQGVSQGTAEITVTAPVTPGLTAVCKVTVIAPPPQIVLSAEKITLGVNEKFALNVGYISDEADYNPPFSCKSSNSKYVTVSADGVVTAKRAGSAKITVSNADGMSAVCTVTVKRAPSSVKLSPANGNLAVGDSASFKWTLSSGSAGSVRFESSDPAVLEVASDGTAVAKSAGTVKVRVITYNGKSATSTVTVHPQPERVEFTKTGDPMRFAIGMKGTLKAVLYPSNFGSVTFASSDPSVIGVDEKTGAYEVHAMGECDLTVTAYNGVSETRHAKVYVAPDYIKAVDTKLTLGVGESYRMRIRCEAAYGKECEPGFSYKSSSTKVATVDENGVITAKKAGSATITATSFNGKKVSCKVTVKKAPTSLKLNATEIVLGQNESFQLTTSLSPSGCGGVVHYESSDNNFAFVDETGRIVANRNYGTVVITASLYNGLSQSCTVTLENEPKSIEFPVDTLELYVGMKLDPQLQVIGGACSSFKTQSSNASVAYMDGSGQIVAKKKGQAEIYVETYNGCRDSIYVTVGAAPSKCYLDLPGTLNVGYLYSLTEAFRTTPQTDPWMSISSVAVSNDRAMVLENEMGLFIMPVEEGSFTVTVKTYNGKSVKKTLKAVYSGQDIEQEITSPVRTDVQLADYLGSWNISAVCSEGMTLPPDMFALQNSSLIVYDGWTEIVMFGERAGTPHRVEGGALLLLNEGGEEELRCQLHENGMLSMPLEEEATLWFRRA